MCIRDRGAHDLVIQANTDANLVFHDSAEGWDCRTIVAQIECRLTQLDAFSSTRLWLDIEGQHEFNYLNTGLATKTRDINPGNNGKPLFPIAAAALNDSGALAASAGGGGVPGPILFLLILCTLPVGTAWRRLKRSFARVAATGTISEKPSR